MSRPAWAAMFLVLLAVLVVGVFLAVDRLASDDQQEATVEKPDLETAAVRITDLQRLEVFPATLRYANPRQVIAVTDGIVTKTPVEGAEVSRGDPLFEINGQPVFLFYGERPMWRSLGPASGEGVIQGPDVEQLELNLQALGYQLPTEPDPLFDRDTVRLVRSWRVDSGLDSSDSIELGRIVYVEGPVRLGRSLVELGAPVAPGMPIVEVSGVVQEVLMELPVDRRDRVSVGSGVVVRLPGDLAATGTVQYVGSVVITPEDRRGTDYVEITIHLDDPDLGAPFNGYPVEVEIVTDRAVEVLAVPVKALVALSEGGYAVEIERDRRIELVGVETGMYADGLVEIRGDLGAGDLVRVPK